MEPPVVLRKSPVPQHVHDYLIGSVIDALGHDLALAEKAGEQEVCTFIAYLLLVIDRYEEPLREQLWALCHKVLNSMPQGEARQDTTDRYVVECNLYRHEKNPEKALEIIMKGLSQGATTSRYTFAGLTCLRSRAAIRQSHWARSLLVFAAAHSTRRSNSKGSPGSGGACAVETPGY